MVHKLARYDTVEHIDMVEIDPSVVEVSRNVVPADSGALDDPRVSNWISDGLRYVRTGVTSTVG